jgi:putative ABC transport system substrate-binding protein
LQETGYVEGRNITVEYRFAEGQNDRLPVLAADLVQRGVAVVFAGDNAAAAAAKTATSTIPVVFWVGGDPVKMGLVSSLGRPGGNVTGVSGLTTALIAKKIQLLHDLVPKASSIGLLVNPANPQTAADDKEALEAGRARGLQVHVVSATNVREIDTAFETLTARKIGALILQGDPFLTREIKHIMALANRQAMPTVYYLRNHVEAGALMSYAPSIVDQYREAGTYVGRILKGEKPADLAVQLAAKLELVINRKTADALGLTIPPQLYVLADEVIE